MLAGDQQHLARNQLWRKLGDLDASCRNEWVSADAAHSVLVGHVLVCAETCKHHSFAMRVYFQSFFESPFCLICTSSDFCNLIHCSASSVTRIFVAD